MSDTCYPIRSDKDTLFPRLRSVVSLAQHLAVLGVRLPALVPRLGVIAFHFVQSKLLLALHADSLLHPQALNRLESRLEYPTLADRPSKHNAVKVAC